MKRISFRYNLYDTLNSKILSYFKKHIVLDDLNAEKLSIGIMVILVNLFKISFILIISSLLGLFKECCIMVILISFLRSNAAGIHSKTSLGCTLITLFVYITSSFLSVHYPLSILTSLLISIISIILLFIYSPSDTFNRPIIGKNRRLKLKLTTVLLSIIYIIINLIIFNETLFNLTMYSLLFQAILVLPITYKILNQSYNNYLAYEDQK